MCNTKLHVHTLFGVWTLAAACLAAGPLQGQSAYFSLEGDFPVAGGEHDFFFDLSRSVGSAEDLRFVTYTYEGGTNAAGDLIAASNFDSVLRVYDGSNSLRGWADSNFPILDALVSWPGVQISDGPLNPDPLLSDSYRLNLSEFGAPDPGPWAVDLIGPADAFTLTGAAPTGASTIDTLKFGTTGPGTDAATYQQTGGTLDLGSGNIVVAKTGNGTLSVEAGGQLSNARGTIGRDAGSTGVATVTGTDGLGNASMWSNTIALHVGRSGNGTLNVEAGGRVSTGPGTIGGTIGVDAGSTGAATVTGTDGSGNASTWTNFGNDLTVGELGDGTLNVEAGGQVSNNSGFIGLSGTGEVTVTGTDVSGNASTWTNSIHLWVGMDGNGTLNVEAGGQVSNVIGRLGANVGSTGVATVTGVDGSGNASRWTNHFFLSVGSLGNATLEVEAGGQVSNESGFIATLPGSVSSATVTGSGSTWSNSGDLFVGGNSTTLGGTGALDINNGGLVEVTNQVRLWNTSTINLDGNALDATLESDLVVVDGTVNDNGGGQIHARVSGAGQINATNLTLGNAAASDGVDFGGTVRIGSLVSSPFPFPPGTLQAVPGTLQLDDANRAELNGTVTIIDGSTLSATNGTTLTSGGVLSVSGGPVGPGVPIFPGQLGQLGNATIDGDFTNEGTVNASLILNTQFLNFNGDVSGDGTYTGSVRFSQGFSPGNSTAIVDAEFIDFQPTSTLSIEIGGTTPGAEFDQVAVSVAALLDGTLDLDLINGFDPQLGDSFLVVSGPILGTFDTIGGAVLGPNKVLAVTYSGAGVTVTATLPGDFDLDFDVDGADFLKWQRGESPDPLSPLDLADWGASYGASAPLVASSAAVPEPSTWMMLLAGMLALRFRRGV